jgi:carbon storage regulator
MLVLTRRVGEVIKIGDDIEVTILDARGKQVRLGITAPKEVKVLRLELKEGVKVK